MRNCRCWVVAFALRRWPDGDRRASLVEKNLVDTGGAASVAWRKKPAEDARRRRLRSALGEVALQPPASFAERLRQVAFTREPVKRYEHLTGFDASTARKQAVASNSDPCFSPPGLGATYASRGTPSGASASRAASLGSPFETHPSFLPKSAATTKTTIGYK